LVLQYFENRVNTTYRLTLIAVGYTFLGIFYKYSNHKYIDELVNHIFGKKGEDMVASMLGSNFDDSYTYIRNYEIPDKGGDIDGILISPKGVLIIEVKFYSGSFEINDGKFYKFHKKEHPDLCWYNPIKQAEKQRGYLQNLLHRNSINVHVRAVVVLTHGHILAIHGPTGIYILKKEKLVDFIDNGVVSSPALSPQLIEQITNIFKSKI